MKTRMRGRRAEMEAEIKLAYEEFYCSWGRHRTMLDYRVNTKFEHGTMCWTCQLAITENIREVLLMPELNAGLRERERRIAALARREKVAVAKARKGSTDAGFVYYMRINKQIKIGYTADIKTRMRHYPPGTELLAVEPGTMFTERERHQDFARYLLRGREWFEESEPVKKHIAMLRESHGDPSALAYEYTQPQRAG